MPFSDGELMKNDVQQQVGLFVIPPAFVDRAWKDGAHNLAKACDRAKEEITGDQLKLMLSRGERTLVALDRGGEKLGWAVVTAEQLPNTRVFYVWSLYAPHHSLDMYQQINRMALEAGCSFIRGAVDEFNERLWRRINAQKVYSVYQIEVKP